MGKVGELQDIEDEPEAHRLEGVDPAEGDPIKKLLKENARIHFLSSSVRWARKRRGKTEVSPRLYKGELHLFRIVLELYGLDLVAFKFKDRHLQSHGAVCFGIDIDRSDHPFILGRCGHRIPDLLRIR